MAKFQGGLDEMVKALQLMSTTERKTLLQNLANKDPAMANAIESKLFTLEQLTDISPKMLVEFLREIKLTDLALALKIYSKDLQDYLLANVSKSMATDINDVLNGPKRRQSECDEANALVLSVFRKMIDDERIILSKDDKMV